MLFTQGVQSAELLSSKLVPLFRLCEQQLSPQSHYDFGLRALKPVLLSAGRIIRQQQHSSINQDGEHDSSTEEQDSFALEKISVLRAIDLVVTPKLVRYLTISCITYLMLA